MTLASTIESPGGAGQTQDRHTWIVLGVALIARLTAVWDALTSHPHDWLYTRGMEMGLLANSLLHGQGYSSPFGGSTGPTAFIAPGYPTLIAAIFLIFGSDSFASVLVIVGLQILLGLLTIWLMMYVARETMGERAAVFAGTFWAISPPLLFIPTIFWETSLSACAVIGAIALALRCQRRMTTRKWVVLGAYCGVVGLINPALLPTLLAVLGWIAYKNWGASRTAPLIGIATLCLVFAPWPIRNALRFHAFIPTRTTVGFELWMGNRAGSNGYLDESVFPMFNKAELASYLDKGELRYTDDKSEAAKDYIRANPGRFIRMSLRRFARFWTGTGNLVGSPIYAIHACLTSALGIAGLIFLYVRRKIGLAILMTLPVILFPLPYYISHAEFRYRLNIDPLMTVLAAYAVTMLVERSQGDIEDAAVPT